MRIACTSTPEGNVYRFYRTDLDVTAALKPIVPFLLASRSMSSWAAKRTIPNS